MPVIKIVPMPGKTVAGERGPEGPRGYQGEQGFSGQDGWSAYQIAVNNGFVGTEQQWLDSLSASVSGATGSFVSNDNKMVTVSNGLIVSIEEIV